LIGLQLSGNWVNSKELQNQENQIMAEYKKNVYVRVRDGSGNLSLCPIEALKDPKEATEEELENWVDNAVVGRYAGAIEVIDKWCDKNPFCEGTFTW